MSVSYGGDSITFADNSTVTSGWTGFKNRLINGAMVIDQRNAGAAYTLSSAQNFSCDRWKCWSNITSGSTVQQVSDAPAGFTKSIKITVGTGATPGALDYGRIWQGIEGYNWADMRWGFSDAKTVTISFWVKSSLTGTFGVGVMSNSYWSYSGSYTINSANTWEYKTVTVTGQLTAGTTDFPIDNNAAVYIGFDLGEGATRSNADGVWVNDGTYSHFGLTGGTKVLATSGATFQVTGVQVEKGSTASSFEYRPYPVELMMCQRYYVQTEAVSFSFEYPQNGGGYYSGNSFRAAKFFALPVEMRVAPTAVASYSSSGWTAAETTGASSSTGAWGNRMVYWMTPYGSTGGGNPYIYSIQWKCSAEL